MVLFFSQNALAQLNKKVQGWKHEIALKKKEIEEMKQNLENERPLLTKALIEDRLEEIDFKEKKLIELRQSYFGPEGKLIKQKKTLIKPVQDQVFAAIQKVGKTRQYDFIFENSASALLLYSANRHDISDMILDMINRKKAVREIKHRREELKNKQAERKQERKEIEHTNEPYKSVRQAAADRKEKAERQAKIRERKQERQARIEARQRKIDSMRAAREAAVKRRQQEIRERRAEMKRKRDSIMNARKQRINSN